MAAKSIIDFRPHIALAKLVMKIKSFNNNNNNNETQGQGAEVYIDWTLSPIDLLTLKHHQGTLTQYRKYSNKYSLWWNIGGYD